MAKLIEPWIARPVAARLTGDRDLRRSYLLERLQRDLERVVPLAEELVKSGAGTPQPPPVQWRLIDRAVWAEANIHGLEILLAPLADKVAQRMSSVPWPAQVAQRTVVSVEVGALLGYLSRRVLGQYDLLVTDAGTADDALLYFVGPNLIETERRFGFVPEDFILWVALHEVTHRFQFAGVAWLRPHFLGLVERYVSSLDIDPRSFASRLKQAVRRLLDPKLPAEEKNPAYLLAGDEQRETLDRLQALMAVVEGHGNFVMDRVGAPVIPSLDRMRDLFDARRAQVGRAQRAINYALGLELKLRQYELGRDFCEAVYGRAGLPGISALWESPGNLPTMKELRAPQLWLERLAA